MAKIYYRRIKAGIMTIDEDKANQEQEQAENAEA